MKKSDLKKLIEEVLNEDIERGSLPREKQEENAIKLFKMAKNFHDKLSQLKNIANVIETAKNKLKEMNLENNNEMYSHYDEDISSDIDDIQYSFTDGLDHMSEFIQSLNKLENGLKIAKEGIHYPEFGPEFMGRPLHPASHRKPVINYDPETSIVKHENKQTSKSKI